MARTLGVCALTVFASSAFVVAPRIVHAQALDSAAARAARARAAFAEAGRAATVREALPHLARAARTWPTQPSYWMSMARAGARMADTAAVHEALVALASLETGRGLLMDSAMRRLTLAPTLRASVTALERATAPIVGGHVVAAIADSNVFAEGIDANTRTGHLYVGSVRQRTVLEITPNGDVRDLAVSRDSRVGAVLGVRVARDGKHLYATTATLPMMHNYSPLDSAVGAIVYIRIADGAVLRRWEVPRDGSQHLLGDLAIAADGTVFATDSYAPVIFVLRPDADTLQQIRHRHFRSLQGIAVIPGHRALVVADYSHGLLRVDIDRESVVRLDDVPGSTTLGIDGIIWHEGAILAVQNGVQPPRIIRITLNAAHTGVATFRVIDRQPAIADEPTIGTLWRGGFVYVANSQWDKYDEAGMRKPGTALGPTRLMCVPLPQLTTARTGMRKTASAPPPSRACKTRDAASP